MELMMMMMRRRRRRRITSHKINLHELQ